jgi:uncharacterized membrane protein
LHRHEIVNPEQSKAQPSSDLEQSANSATHFSRNVATMAAADATAEERVSRHQRLIERITLRLGRPAAIYAAAAGIALWIGVNLALRACGRPALDQPPFFWLQSVSTCFAALVALMVLSTQNRQARQAEKRSELDLQINLLSEQKLAKLIALLEELRRDLPTVPNRDDPVAHAMTEPVDPRAVILALEETFDAKGSAVEADDDGLALATRVLEPSTVPEGVVK